MHESAGHREEKGMLVVLSGPSGVGKGTIVRRYLSNFPDVAYSVSATTRAPRAGEVEGVHYHFYQREQFEAEIAAGHMLEYAVYGDHYYGTPRKFVDTRLAEGKTIILEIEVQGANQIRERCPEALFVFIMPPTFADLKERILYRGAEQGEDLKSRLQIAKTEIENAGRYDYIIVNDEVDRAAACMDSVIKAARCSIKYQKELIEEVLKNAKTID